MLSHGFPKGHLRRPIVPKCSKVILQTSHQSCDFPPTSSISATPSPPAGFSLAWNWEMRQFVSEETSFVPKIVVEWVSLFNSESSKLVVFEWYDWYGGWFHIYMDLAFVGLRLLWSLRCRTHHPCLDSNATLWKNVNSCNLAIWSVFVHLLFNKYKFILDIFQDSTSTSNQSG